MLLLAADDVSSLPQGERLRRLFVAHQTFTENFGRSYRSVNNALKAARDLKTDPTSGISENEREELVSQLEDIRKDTVRYYRHIIRLAESTINEIVPGTFPVAGPLTSEDLDDEKQALRDLADTALAVAGVAALVGAEPVAAFAGGFAAGVYGTLAAGEFAGLW